MRGVIATGSEKDLFRMVFSSDGAAWFRAVAYNGVSKKNQESGALVMVHFTINGVSRAPRSVAVKFEAPSVMS